MILKAAWWRVVYQLSWFSRLLWEKNTETCRDLNKQLQDDLTRMWDNKISITLINQYLFKWRENHSRQYDFMIKISLEIYVTCTAEVFDSDQFSITKI